jgi:hypothetical protein
MKMQEQNGITVGQALVGAQATSKETRVNQPAQEGMSTIERLRAKVLAHKPKIKKMSSLDIVRELFDVLENQRKAGETYEELTELLKPEIEIKDGTLKAMMSKIRTERKIKYVQCPCCQSEVPESQIAEQYRDVVEAAAESVNDT